MPSVLAVLILSLALSASVSWRQAAPATAPNAAQADATATAFQLAFVAADVGAMKEHFADKIVFIGDPRFIGEGGRVPVQRDLTRDQLMVAYEKLFEAMGRTKWTELVKQAKPTLTRATKDGTHPDDTNGLLPAAFVKTGEHMLELRFPGSGLDDVVLFVLRDVAGKWRVVAHWADY